MPISRTITRKMYKSGSTIYEIADATGFSSSSVHRALLAMGIEMRSVGPKPERITARTMRKVDSAYRRLGNYKAVMAELGLSWGQYRQVLTIKARERRTRR